MDLNEYRRLAARTLNSDLPHEMQMTIYGLGLMGEASELFTLFFDGQPQRDEVIKEVGDVAWYAAAICSRLGLRLSESLHLGYAARCEVNPEALCDGEFAEFVVIDAGKVGEMLKKAYGHKHPLDRDALLERIGCVMWWLEGLCDRLGVPLEEALERNIDKLRRRYPEGFSAEASIARVDTAGQHVEEGVRG
ncbi:MazG nucleotide pyrophosphohydrolase domain protein [compost metagenome]